MATVYRHPEHIEEPQYCGDYKKHEDAEKTFIQNIVDFCKENSNCPHAGEEINFPIADGKARYIVLNYRQIIHLPVGDKWSIPDAHARGLRKDDIIQNIESRKALEALFENRN
ncbi:MAG: hypothetical protein CMF13_02245 [Idiomarina sp.]|nr:hypothetical protein [Idiomarina sp.]|tara:strand:- start:519 stop:857 length:339 start_codon:yes stop_codon:yes gene_type:complete